MARIPASSQPSGTRSTLLWALARMRDRRRPALVAGRRATASIAALPAIAPACAAERRQDYGDGCRVRSSKTTYASSKTINK
jgi:hypothetical protein